MRKHMENAIIVSKFLESLDGVRKVYYPLLSTFDQRELVERQMAGCSGMISFELRAETHEDIYAFTSALNLFTLAESLGGYESLVCVPSMMTHVSVDPKHRRAIGLDDNVIRLSVGLEDPYDLCRDIEHAVDYMMSEKQKRHFYRR